MDECLRLISGVCPQYSSAVSRVGTVSRQGERVPQRYHNLGPKKSLAATNVTDSATSLVELRGVLRLAKDVTHASSSDKTDIFSCLTSMDGTSLWPRLPQNQRPGINTWMGNLVVYGAAAAQEH